MSKPYQLPAYLDRIDTAAIEWIGLLEYLAEALASSGDEGSDELDELVQLLCDARLEWAQKHRID